MNIIQRMKAVAEWAWRTEIVAIPLIIIGFPFVTAWLIWEYIQLEREGRRMKRNIIRRTARRG